MDVLTTEHKNLGSNPTINGRAVTGCECVMQYAGTGKEMHEANLFLLQNLALQLGLGLRC